MKLPEHVASTRPTGRKQRRYTRRWLRHYRLKEEEVRLARLLGSARER